MKYLFHIIFVFSFLFISCNPENGDENIDENAGSFDVSKITTEFDFSINIDQTELKVENSYYELENNLLILNAVTPDGERLFITVNNDESDNYKLDNRTFLVTEDNTYFVSEGEMKITENKDDLISGNFNLKATSFIDTNDIRNVNGDFSNVSKLEKDSESIKFTVSQVMEVDAVQGNVEYKDCNLEVELKDYVVIFRNLDDATKSFSVKTDNAVNEGTSFVYNSSDMEINKVFADLIKKQATIFYKNGNSKIYY